MWSVNICQPNTQAYHLASDLPVNVLPNTSSSGGTSSFGVMVSVTESFEGSRLGSFLIEASSVCKLYDLRQLGFASSLNGVDGTPKRPRHCFAPTHNTFEPSMLSRPLRYRSQKARVYQSLEMDMVTPCNMTQGPGWTKKKGAVSEIDAGHQLLTASR
jgi:hypothetical protein